MIPVLTSANVHDIDSRCEDDYGLSSGILMENASRSAVEVLRELLPMTRARVLIACGNGNNGGDGYAIARLLSDWCTVTVLGDGPNDSQSEAAQLQAAIAASLVPIHPWSEAPRLCSRSWDVVIDAIVGVGGSAHLRPESAMLCAMLDNVAALKIAIDVPTGLDASSGHAHADAFVAHHTITMVAPKAGMYLNDGPKHCGVIHTASIGAPASIVESVHPVARILEPSDIASLLPPRQPSATKFDMGRVLVVGGCRSMPGAPSLSAHAAVVAGAGLVELASTMIHPATPREVMPTLVPATRAGTISAEALPMLIERASKATVIVVGPGLSRVDETIDTIGAFLREIDPAVPVVLDADGIAAFPFGAPFRTNMVITPHIGEFAGATGRSVADIAQAPLEVATEAAKKSGCTIHLKHTPSITTNGVDAFFSVMAVPEMASGGMGDVLSGIIAACIAQGVHRQHFGLAGACALAAYLHARSGQQAARRSNGPAVTASMVIDALPFAFAE